MNYSVFLHANKQSCMQFSLADSLKNQQKGFLMAGPQSVAIQVVKEDEKGYLKKSKGCWREGCGGGLGSGKRVAPQIKNQ